jgi:trans-2,3-dihydro-3-hydroxyanthranilate isomerase
VTEIELWLVDAFTDTPLRGNPAAVVPDATGLDEDQCRQVASEVGVSETAFVFPEAGEGADFRLRFFTPTQEVDLCGHATVGAFWALAVSGGIDLEEGANRFVQETNVGNLPVWIHASGGEPERVMMGQKLPRFETPELSRDKMAALFGIGRKQVKEDLPVEIVSTGMRSIHIPVAGLASFPEVKILRKGVAELSHTHGASTVQLFAMEARHADADAHCRVFAPAVGVDEDPVTGTAAGALGAYIVRHGLKPEGKDGVTRILVEQGEEINRTGLVEVVVERDDEEFVGIRVGGRATVSLRGSLRIS